MNIEIYLEEKRKIVDEYLDKYLPKEKEYPTILHEAMRYSVFSGGKRFRPILAIAVCEACGGTFEDVISTACALEMIHAYSLIHDDLPAMDDDDFRRGKESNHKKYGEDVAILAGDALLTKAFEVLDVNVVKDIAKAIGSFGVVGGQVVDMQLARGELEIDLPLIEYIHTRKTGALIAVSCIAGAKLAKKDENVIEIIKHYGEKLGFAFQIIDDVFDNENYAVLLGDKEARVTADNIINEAKQGLESLDIEKKDILIALADYVVKRKN
jgi:geranylgeranyl diphosphate synthase, type II